MLPMILVRCETFFLQGSLYPTTTNNSLVAGCFFFLFVVLQSDRFVSTPCEMRERFCGCTFVHKSGNKMIEIYDGLPLADRQMGEKTFVRSDPSEGA